MVLFLRFYALVLVLPAVFCLSGCERSTSVARDTLVDTSGYPTNLFQQLPSKCLDANPAIQLTTPKRVFLFAHIPHANKSSKTYRYWAFQFADQSTAEIDLWEDGFDKLDHLPILMDFAFADAIEMCNYFQDTSVRTELGTLPQLSHATSISTHINTLTEKFVIDKDPAVTAFALKIYNLDYPQSKRTEYLQTTIATENTLASQPEVLRMEVYENFYAGKSPNRVLVVSFRNLADLKTFMNVSRAVADIEEQIRENAAKVWERCYTRSERIHLVEGRTVP